MKLFSANPYLSLLLQPRFVQVFLLLLAALLLNLVARYLLLHAKASLRLSHGNDALVQAAERPLPLFIFLLGISFALGIASQGYAVFDIVRPVRNVGIIACLAWFMIRFIYRFTGNVIALRLKNGEEVDLTTFDALSKLARLTVIVLTSLAMMQTLDFSISGVLTAGGIGGIALGFAAKDLLANFFGGLTIYLDRPFSVGDWIRSPDKQIEGTVEYISWRHTRIRAFNKNPIYVPNALFTTIVVENPSRMTHRRIKETVGIRYQDIGAITAIVTAIKAMLTSHPEIDATQTLIVSFDTFSASSLDVMIYTFTRTSEWVRYHEIKQDVLLSVAAIIEQHGAQLAFPTHTVHLEAAGVMPQ